MKGHTIKLFKNILTKFKNLFQFRLKKISQTWIKYLWVEGIQICSYKGTCPFIRGDTGNIKNSKYMYTVIKCKQLSLHHLHYSLAYDPHRYFRQSLTNCPILKMELFISLDAWFSLWLKQCKRSFIGRAILIDLHCKYSTSFWIWGYVKGFLE